MQGQVSRGINRNDYADVMKDTTSTTLTYLFWELAKHPVWQDQLREELSARKHDDVPKYTSIVDLPILDAIVNESLRLHPAAPASLVRSTPAGGRMLDGYFMPEGVSLSQSRADRVLTMDRLSSPCNATQRRETLKPFQNPSPGILIDGCIPAKMPILIEPKSFTCLFRKVLVLALAKTWR